MKPYSPKVFLALALFYTGSTAVAQLQFVDVNSGTDISYNDVDGKYLWSEESLSSHKRKLRKADDVVEFLGYLNGNK